MTLLLVRTPGAPRASAGTVIYPGPQHVAGGRRFVRDTLDAWNQAEIAPTACLLVSELLTNAMRHTSEPIGLRRLEARPIATLSIEAQERHERRERVYRDD